MKVLAVGLAALAVVAPSASVQLRAVSNVKSPGAIGTDLAFSGTQAYQGHYNGFRIIDLSTPARPVVLASVTCRGPQGDVSVWQNLLFVSVDRPQTAPTCDSVDAAPVTDPAAWEGIRIFDISTPNEPRFVTGVATDCGSHTHSLLPDPARNRVLLYASSYSLGGPHCGPTSTGDPQHAKISIVEVPLATPEHARVVATPVVDAPPAHLRDVPPTVGCHDITFFTPLKLAAASCMSEGQLWDVSDPVQPRTVARFRNPSVGFWHSAAFTWDGKYVVFGDESFPGSCNNGGLSGRIWFYRLTAPAKPVGSYVISRRQPGQVCSAHLFDVVPVKGRYLLVSSWYFGGANVVDFTDPRKPRELAFYDKISNHWAAYWYNGHVYGSDFERGLDVLSMRGVSGARTLAHLNPQTQELLIR